MSSFESYKIQAPVSWDGREELAELELTNYGATVMAFRVPVDGKTRDIVLGPGVPELYPKQDRFFGAFVGRVANRIGQASFDLNGRHYPLAANNGPNSLHGGVPGFHEVFWEVEKKSANEITLRRVSPDGEAGYPGDLDVRVTYRLEGGKELSWVLIYEATSSAPTLCNLTQHTYWNLNGQETNHLRGHVLQVFANQFTEVDANSTPTGRLLDVEGTGLDFRQPRDLGEVLAEPLTCPHLQQARGVDHNFVLHTRTQGPMREAARVTTKDLELRCETTQPGVQVYSANYVNGHAGKPLADGTPLAYNKQCGLCLETQAWPDAPHHSSFPPITLEPGELYRRETRYVLRRLH